MKRVVVVGSSSSGKTTVSRHLAAVLGHPHLELDSVHHQEGWTHPSEQEFERIVSGFVSRDSWVVDGNYTSHGTTRFVWPRADTIVWLDVPKSVVMRRVILRTLRRVLTREVLWNGNREPWTNLYSRDPWKNIIVWAWTRFDGTRAKYEEHLTDGSWSHATVHRLSSTSEVTEFLNSLDRQPSQ